MNIIIYINYEWVLVLFMFFKQICFFNQADRIDKWSLNELLSKTTLANLKKFLVSESKALSLVNSSAKEEHKRSHKSGQITQWPGSIACTSLRISHLSKLHGKSWSSTRRHQVTHGTCADGERRLWHRDISMSLSSRDYWEKTDSMIEDEHCMTVGLGCKFTEKLLWGETNLTKTERLRTMFFTCIWHMIVIDVVIFVFVFLNRRRWWSFSCSCSCRSSFFSFFSFFYIFFELCVISWGSRSYYFNEFMQ